MTSLLKRMFILHMSLSITYVSLNKHRPLYDPQGPNSSIRALVNKSLVLDIFFFSCFTAYGAIQFLIRLSSLSVDPLDPLQSILSILHPLPPVHCHHRVIVSSTSVPQMRTLILDKRFG